jgi:hypothetical protein
MQVIADQLDHCPYCHNRLEIVCVKFRFSSVATVSVCPNCAVVAADQRADAKPADLISANQPTREEPADKEPSLTEAFRWRYRRALAFILGAVITAAFLRHTIHVQGGIAPADIGVGAVVIAAAMVLAMVLLRKRRTP